LNLIGSFATPPASNTHVSSSVPVPQESPIPVGLKTELQPTQQYPSFPLILPVQSEPTDNQKVVSTSEDTLSTLSQQEGLSIKGMFTLIKTAKRISYFFIKSGREQRHFLSQKLGQRRLDSRVCVIRNMANAEDVNDDLQQEVTG